MTESPTRHRLEALRRGLADGGAGGPDAVLVTNADNRRYLSGFTGSAGTLLITAGAARLLTDFRYVEQAAGQAPDFEIVQVAGSAWPAVAGQIRELQVARLGFEAEDLTVDAFDQLRDAVAADSPAELVPTRGLVEGLRQIKDSPEVDSIRRAVEIGDRAFEAVAAGLRPGISEREVAWRLEVAMREMGADGLSFPIIVAAGPNGAMPHHRPSDRSIEAGEPVVIDMGCRRAGYCSDMTRTITVGAADARFWEIHEIVLRAQQTCIAGLKAGMTGKAGDALARDVIVAAGHGDHFGHGTGHGVGLAIHENPRLSPTAAGAAALPERTVVTVEPGIYLPGWGGIRIEDMVVVGQDRCLVLTTAHKSPVVGMGMG
jgi:Xaa-Pro aminopeptidase